jgi:3-phosphoshikimate 1-carboxyvinyltransferase
MAAGLRACGVAVDAGSDGDWTVTAGTPASGAGTSDVTVDCGNAGTVARFLPPAAAVLTAAPVHVDGDARMRERPLRPLLEALARLGVEIDDGGRGAMPFTLRAPTGVRGGEITLDASSSSQLVSGLLLAAPQFADGIVVRHVGAPVPSAPHLRMTVAMLRESGAVVDDSTPDVWAISPGPLTALDRAIEPDLSSASAFLAAAAATGGRVTLEGWPLETEQPGRLLPALLEAFGCRCELDGDGDGSRLTVTGPGRLTGVDLDLHEYGEATPTLCALAVLASGPSRLRGVAHLRLQETDRLAALAEEFGRLGARIDVTEDGLAITPAALRGGTLDPRADHRLAMAYAVVGLTVPGVQVLDVATTGKTVPDFPERWAALVAAGPTASNPS